jgi:4-amino-4-deoxy-L-arabinose transferase-like glycosyltransferase
MQLPKKLFLSLLLLEIFVNFSGIGVPFFSNDPALYAAISKAMVQRNDYINLYVYGVDWLDKPHFPFWMAAFSFKLFGVSEWAYRLPALLFILLGTYYSYLLAKQLYNTGVAQVSVLVLLAAQHLLMSNTDVRAEPYLLALVVGAVYHFYNLFGRFNFLHLVLGSLLAACAVMTKGIFALVPIGTAIVGYAIFTRQLNQFVRWRWLLAAIFLAVFMFPEVYAVYVQFDQHPEKIVFNTTGISGIKWFLWDSQFSRFVMQGPIVRAKGDVFYYVHTLLWAYAPWCLVLYFVFTKLIVAIGRKQRLQEYVNLSAIIPMLLFFSLSKFQLNFYTNILFPFFSILVASFVASSLSPRARAYYIISQTLYSSIFLLGTFVIILLLSPHKQWLYLLGGVACITCVVMVLFKTPSVNLRYLIISCLSTLYINFCLNFSLYPKMSSLKGENQAAAYVNEFYPDQKLGVIENRRSGFEFYSHQPVQQINIDRWLSGAGSDRIYYVDNVVYGKLLQKNARFIILKQFDDHSSENILKFMRSKDNSQTVQQGYLIKAQ